MKKYGFNSINFLDCLGFSLNEQVAGKSEYLNCRHANSLSIEAKSDHFDGF